MIFQLCKWHFDINWHKFEKRWADGFQIYPNAIHLNPLQFCPSMPLLGFPVFSLSSSIVLNRYFHILVNSMTIWSLLKLPKIAWPSPFNRARSFMVYCCLFGVLHRRSKETTWRLIPRSPSWRRERRQNRIQTCLETFKISPIILSNIQQSAAFPYIKEARKAAKL